MEILELFPTPVGTAHIGRNLTIDELNFIDSLNNENDAMYNGPNADYNKITKNIQVLHEEPLQNLKHDLEEIIQEYFMRVWCPKQDVRVYITTSWFTFTRQGQEHFKHSHPNSFISGTFYPTSSDNDTITYADDNRDVHYHFDIPPAQENQFNSRIYTDPTPHGSIKMFPAKLKHQVLPKEDNHPRVCLAFNTWLTGTIGTVEQTTLLTL
jgi:uncharacterized protein (TIGR02466 family)